jgi:hypothetical protein
MADENDLSPPNIMGRLAARVNLLAEVPDDAPCFRPGPRSDEILMALAVLAGDTSAAAALADEIVEKHGRVNRTFSDGDDIVAFYEGKIRELSDECVYMVGQRSAKEGAKETVGEALRNSLMKVIRAQVLGPYILDHLADLAAQSQESHEDHGQ